MSEYAGITKAAEEVAVRDTQVDNRASGLEREVETIRVAVLELERRLAPVLRVERVADSNDLRPAREVQVPLADRILAIDDSLTDVRARVQSLIDRLEV